MHALPQKAGILWGLLFITRLDLVLSHKTDLTMALQRCFHGNQPFYDRAQVDCKSVISV